jgi:hypothetical protein
MDRKPPERVLGLSVVVAVVVGVAFIILGDAMLTTVGILLVIASAVGFLVVVKDFIVGQEGDASSLREEV